VSAERKKNLENYEKLVKVIIDAKKSRGVFKYLNFNFRKLIFLSQIKAKHDLKYLSRLSSNMKMFKKDPNSKDSEKSSSSNSPSKNDLRTSPIGSSTTMNDFNEGN